MIHTVPNPKMTSEDVREFRENFARCVSKDIPAEVMSKVKERKKRIDSVYNTIIRNNGGRNPILGY